MKYNLGKKIKEILLNKRIIFSKSDIREIDDILNVYSERMIWFKEKGIRQWGKYLEHHPKEEFEDVIRNGYFFTLKQDNEVIAGFELSTDSKYWNDDTTKAYYIYKVVTKVGSKDIGNLIFDICKDIAKTNNQEYLRLDCLSTNKRLNEIYESHNFKLIRTGYDDHYPYNLRECEIVG